MAVFMRRRPRVVPSVLTTQAVVVTEPAVFQVAPDPITIVVSVLTTSNVQIVNPFESGLPAQLDTTYSPPVGGTLWSVHSGDNLQTVINSAQPGDIIELDAGVTFTGNFTLPNKTGNAWIYVRTSNYANLPAPGTRVSPADVANMAKLRTTNTVSLLLTNSGAHNFRFVGIEFESTYSTTSVIYNIIRLQGNATDITFDRCYVHGAPLGNTYDGISVFGIGRLGVVDSYISEIHVAQGQAESHGIIIISASGPVKIENNYIEAAGENILIGGLGVNTGNVSTTDLTVRRNYLFKPLAWKNAIASGPNAGLKWKVKNLFELKEGNRVLVEGNVMENNWAHAQSGYGVLFTPRDTPISDVTFRLNYLKNSELGFQIGTASMNMQRVLLENNVATTYGVRIFNLSRGGGGPVTDLTIRHNTAVATSGTGTAVFLEGSVPALDRWIVYDNILNNGYGILASGKASGLPSVTFITTNYDWSNNVVIGAATYATDAKFRNFLYATSNGTVGFVEPLFTTLADYALAPSSSFNNAATDGTDVGCDVPAVVSATAGCITGVWA